MHNKYPWLFLKIKILNKSNSLGSSSQQQQLSQHHQQQQQQQQHAKAGYPPSSRPDKQSASRNAKYGFSIYCFVREGYEGKGW